MEFVEIDKMRMEPDVYDGPNCDQHRPRWIGSGEKEGDFELGGDIILDPALFPPGTQVIIKTPICPKCEEIYDNCMVRGYGDSSECDFDWKIWTEEQYS